MSPIYATVFRFSNLYLFQQTFLGHVSDPSRAQAQNPYHVVLVELDIIG